MSSDLRCIDPRRGLQDLIDVLIEDGYRVLGPVARDGVITYTDVTSADELPTGYRVEQAPGRWRMQHTGEPQRFSWTPGAESWKRFGFPAREEVLRIRRSDGVWTATPPPAPERPLALLGARDCELRALGILDRVMLDPDRPDDQYAQRRNDTFVVAVACDTPSGTCWCTSIGGGPDPEQGFDLKITELPETELPEMPHRLLVEAATERGRRVLQRIPSTAALPDDAEAARTMIQRATDQMPIRLRGTELPQLLEGTENHPQWDLVAQRCLSCGNCTMVCPTCFCSTYSDETSMNADEAVRSRTWASCFELDHSHLGGWPVRSTTANRYRQWLLHKLQTWPEQFGTPGCVGCGRCTTWCPAAIDLVEEAKALCGDPT